MSCSPQSCTWRVSPIPWLTVPVDAGRCRVSIDIDLLVSKPDSSLVEPSERLRKPARLRVTGRYGRLDDIELVFVHVRRCESPGFIGIGEHHLMSFDEVVEIPLVLRHLRVPLHELPRRMNKSGSQINLPPPLSRTSDSRTHDVAGGAGLGFFREYSLDLIVIDHRYRVAALALSDAINACRKVGSIFGSISRLRNLWLTREKAGEAVFTAGKLH